MMQFSLSSSAVMAINSYKKDLIDTIKSDLSDKQFIQLIEEIDKKYIEEIAKGVKLKNVLSTNNNDIEKCFLVAKSLQNRIKLDSKRIKELNLVTN